MHYTSFTNLGFFFIHPNLSFICFPKLEFPPKQYFVTSPLLTNTSGTSSQNQSFQNHSVAKTEKV